MREDQRKRYMAVQVGDFAKKYARKKVKGYDPNDRSYSRKVEKKVRQMKPEDLDELLRNVL